MSIFLSSFLPQNVELHWFIIAQVLGVFSIICYFISFQQKEKRKLLAWLCFGSVFNIMMMFFMSLWLLGLLRVIALLRNLVFILLDKYRDKIALTVSIIILLIFLALASIVTVFTFTWWFEFVVLGIFLIHIFALWKKGIHFAKISGAVYSATLVVLNVMALNYMGVAIELNFIIAAAVFYVMLCRKGKGEKKKADNGEEYNCEMNNE